VDRSRRVRPYALTQFVSIAHTRPVGPAPNCAGRNLDGSIPRSLAGRQVCSTAFTVCTRVSHRRKTLGDYSFPPWMSASPPTDQIRAQPKECTGPSGPAPHRLTAAKAALCLSRIQGFSIMDASGVKEIVISAHESAHAVASVRLGLPFEYVTLDDPDIGPHVQHFENHSRPIVFYRGGGSCCNPNQPMCERCRAEEKRAEFDIVMAMCGSLGAAATGCNAFGYGDEADKAYVVEFCRTAFSDRTEADVNARMNTMLQRACDLMQPEGKTVTAVAKALIRR
jgi:hypothetical protein